ncbi:MAG TPA: hypothetical protein VFS83_20565, partial [Ktedonobacterales bacterium]|nr:hypothetical protein [Ktedonobacterales bacterium]
MTVEQAQTIHQLPPQFRPTIIVIVGDTGRAIYDQAARLFAGLDETLRTGVVTLECVTTDTMRRLPLVIDGSGAAAPPTSSQPGGDAEVDVATAIHTAIRDVQSFHELEKIKDAGYRIPTPRTQVVIVSSANDPSLPAVTEQVCDALRGWPEAIGAYVNFETLVTYVLTA